MIPDYRSETWRFVCKHIETRIEELRRKNDAAELDMQQTALVRGRIAELKLLLSLPEKGKPVEVE